MKTKHKHKKKLKTKVKTKKKTKYIKLSGSLTINTSFASDTTDNGFLPAVISGEYEDSGPGPVNWDPGNFNTTTTLTAAGVLALLKSTFPPEVTVNASGNIGTQTFSDAASIRAWLLSHPTYNWTGSGTSHSVRNASLPPRQMGIAVRDYYVYGDNGVVLSHNTIYPRHVQHTYCAFR